MVLDRRTSWHGRNVEAGWLGVTVLDDALASDAPMHGDATDGWQSPAIEWVGLLAAAGVPFRTGADASADPGVGLLVVPDVAGGAEAAEAADRAAACDRPLIVGPPPRGVDEALAQVRMALGALVRPDLRGVLVLRLDDPGAAVRRYLSSWRHDDVPAATWSALWDAVAPVGRLSVFCCPGWVEPDGTVAASREVNPAEWAALDAGVARGVADLECHGYTHMHPDTRAWAASPDRFDADGWYRELAPPLPVDADEPSVGAQRTVLAAWQAACGPATTLVAPGEAWGLNTVAAARAAGLQLFTSWAICRLQLPVPTWTRAIGSPYLDEPDPTWLAATLPAVGYWHDRDMVVNGPDWVDSQLTAWRDCGMNRTWAFADLARAYATEVEAYLVGREVVVAASPVDTPLLVERAS